MTGQETRRYITAEDIMKWLAAILFIIVGWLFTIIINSQQNITMRLEKLTESVAVIRVHQEALEGRVDRLAQQNGR